MTPLPADQTLDAYFLEARCKLLDVAAILDRIDRGSPTAAVKRDPRMAKLFQAIAQLGHDDMDRAEAVQKIFSMEYDPNWKIPNPK